MSETTAPDAQPHEPLTFTVIETSKIMNLGRAATYAGIRSGEIPSVRVGRRLLVPRARLLRMLDGQA